MSEETKTVTKIEKQEAQSQPEERERIDLVFNIDDKKIIAKRPKIKILKTVMQLNVELQDNGNLFGSIEGMDKLLKLTVDIFDNEELTLENIEEANLEDIFMLADINDWINQYFPQKKITESKEVAKMRKKQSKKP